MEGGSTPSVSSQIMPDDEMLVDEMPFDERLVDESLVDEMPVLEEAPTYEIPQEQIPEVPQEQIPEVPQEQIPEVPQEKLVDDLRRIAIYSDDGQESLTLGVYTLPDGTQRIILNNIDIPLSDFRGYFKCLTKVEEYHHDDLFFVGIHASFMTGVIVLVVAFGLALLKTEMPALGFWAYGV
jgi:hypothetical protein